ncbi:MAG: hypothetical protein KDD92_08985 [Caldilineaceae bacterium]|nr:hypothetical protein [Caldilineaceae bacterium]
MRSTVVIFVVTMTVALAATVLFFSFAPAMGLTAEAASASTDASTEMNTEASTEADTAFYVDRALTLQKQAGELQRTIDERQAIFADQLTALTNAQNAADEKLTALIQQEEALSAQLEKFTAARAGRSAQYAQQLQGAQSEYAARAQMITAQINEAQARLDEVNQVLGR